MKKSYPSIQLFTCLLFLNLIAQAQTNVADTAFVRASLDFARQAHATKTRQQSPLFNGSQYGLYDSRKEEHPYFLKDDWSEGSIVYSSERFDNISLMYDLSTDKVIAEHFSGAYVELITAKVSSFVIDGHTFRKFKKSDDTRNSITEGFYEVLYDGKITVLKRHTKNYVEMVRSTEIIVSFDEKTRYFLVKDNTFYSIGSRAGMINILSDKKKELKKFSRSNTFNNSQDDTIFVQLATYYDSLTQ